MYQDKTVAPTLSPCVHLKKPPLFWDLSSTHKFTVTVQTWALPILKHQIPDMRICSLAQICLKKLFTNDYAKSAVLRWEARGPTKKK